MNRAIWQRRQRERADLVTRLTHLTRGNDENEAFDTLCRILNDKRLIANDLHKVNINNEKVCCFQEIPLVCIAENLHFEKSIEQNNVRYSPFGLRFLKRDVFQKGGRPVIYGDSEILKSQLPKSEHWRIVKMDLSNTDKIVDWSHEREWRYNGDYQFDYSDVEIIVATPQYYRKMIEWCLENEKRTEVLKQVNGIIVLNSVYN